MCVSLSSVNLREEGNGSSRAAFPEKSGAYFLLLHKVHKSCPFDLDGLTLSVVQSQDEVEKIGLPQIGRRLFLVMRPRQTHSAAGEKR